MFSQRFQWDLTTNALTELRAAKQRAGIRVFDLTVSNPTAAGFDYPQAALLNGLQQAEAMRYYAEPRGLLTARTAVCTYYDERGLTVAPETLHLTASTSEAYAFLFKLLCDDGNEVLIAQPSYPLFEFLAALEGVALRSFALEYLHPHGWRLDFASLRAALTPRTRAIILVNPNNPTGSFIQRHEVAELNALCSAHDLALIVDEVFGDYQLAANTSGMNSFVTNDATLTFVLSGLSKILALPQMKLGWIVTNGPPHLRAAASERLDIIADTFLSVSTPIQLALPHWLPLRSSIQTQIRQRLTRNLQMLQMLCQASSCRVLTVEGGWYATLELPRLQSDEALVLQLLNEDNIFVHPGYFFDFSRAGYLVVSLLTPTNDFATACERIVQRFAVA